MSNKIKAAIIGYGNVGRAVRDCISCAGDFEFAGWVRREGSAAIGTDVTVSDITKLSCDVAILCSPSRLVPSLAAEMSGLGVASVDSYDIHSGIAGYDKAQNELCLKNKTVSVIGAGWDPGFDSVLRLYLQAMAPAGETFTNFGPGMSMGHSVAAKSIAGVKKAVSFTLPDGKGIHSRRVCIELEEGFELDAVAEAIKKDSYFAHDKTTVELVYDVDAIVSPSHGVLLERTGASGTCAGQKFSFDMRINNPALTAQILTACARAAVKLAPGCYTMADIPPMLLSGTDRASFLGSAY